MVINSVATTAGSVGSQLRRASDANLQLLLAFAFVLAGPSLAGSTDTALPGIGTFAYNGSPIATSAPQSLVVAAR